MFPGNEDSGIYQELNVNVISAAVNGMRTRFLVIILNGVNFGLARACMHNQRKYVSANFAAELSLTQISGLDAFPISYAWPSCVARMSA